MTDFRLDSTHTPVNRHTYLTTKSLVAGVFTGGEINLLADPEMRMRCCIFLLKEVALAAIVRTLSSSVHLLWAATEARTAEHLDLHQTYTLKV